MRITAYNTRFSDADDVVVVVAVFVVVVVVQRVCTIPFIHILNAKEKASGVAAASITRRFRQNNARKFRWIARALIFPFRFIFSFYQVIGGAYEPTLRRAASMTSTPLSSLRTIVRVNQSTFDVICLHSIALCCPLTRVQHFFFS